MTPVNSVLATDADRVLDQIERVVRWSDEFRLAFIKCNQSNQREKMQRALLKRLSDKSVLEIFLDKPIVSLLDELKARRDTIQPVDAICVYGLEYSLRDLRETSPVLGRLNHDRDLIRQAIPAALLIWLPDFALDYIARGAPDFWAWRSGVYEFPTDVRLWQKESSVALEHDSTALLSLPLEDKQKEIAHIEELLRTARALPQQDRRVQDTIARLSDRLGVVQASIGNFEAAGKNFEKSLAIWETLGDQANMAGSYHQLGNVAYLRGDYKAALDWYRRSLEIDEALGDRVGMASSYHQLGMVAQDKGDYKAALYWYRRSLEIKEALGDRVGVASSYHQLGNVSLRGDYEAALDWYRRSLEIKEALGDRAGMAISYHQLGNVSYLRGDYEAALDWYRRALEIFEALGDRANMASSYSQIGVLLTETGKPEEAVPLNLRSLAIRLELGVPEARIDLHWLTRQREALGEQRFLEVLKQHLDENDVNAVLKLLEDFAAKQ